MCACVCVCRNNSDLSSEKMKYCTIDRLNGNFIVLDKLGFSGWPDIFTVNSKKKASENPLQFFFLRDSTRRRLEIAGMFRIGTHR